MESFHSREAVLLRRYLDGAISEPETEELFIWLRENFFENSVAFGEVLSDYYQQSFGEHAKINPTAREAILQKLLSQIHGEDVQVIMQDHVPVKRMRNSKWLRAAAAAIIFIALSLGSYFLVFKRSDQPLIVEQTQSERFKNDVAPGKFRARLTLDDGSFIVLDSVRIGELAREGRMKVTNENGTLVYQHDRESGTGDVMRFNTLTTASGETYSTVLSDGTKVWLNSASSITFPVSFSGDMRKVTITGEAYFEVVHDSRHPFLVIANDVEIRDLGTGFNVNAYMDEVVVKTTLITGKAEVVSAGVSQTITPGQQVIVNADKKLSLERNPDVDQALAWKNGRFMFRNADIQSLMRQIARWYDVEVAYVSVPETALNATINRETPLSSILKALELTGKVKFRIDGKTVTVMR